jgi:hydroxypyruvate reductase
VRAALWHGSVERSAPNSLFVVAAGKAAWGMARAFAECEGPRIATGLIAGPRDSDQEPPVRFDSLSPSHPSPNADSEEAGRRALALAGRSRSGTLVVLLSGGASAMLVSPAGAVTVDDKARAARALMNDGAAIGELNCVRKHLSAIKGGRLAAAASRTITLAISDVHSPVPDDPSVIGSGPTVADATTFQDALDLVSGCRDAASIPRVVTEHLEAGVRGELEETPKPGDSRLAQSSYQVIASRQTAMEGAAREAARCGYAVEVIEPPTAGEARDAAAAFVSAALARHASRPRPVCVIASGETTVHVRGTGRGGRNQEFALAGLPLLESSDVAQSVTAALASVGTDGIDGPTDAAGAIVDTTTSARARSIGLSAEAALAENGAYDFFQPLGDLVIWGPTGTNVGDVHVLLVA